jgi:ABC-2 type transport system ATP-binding protein
MTAMIEATALGKQYRGRWALRDCGLAVPPGKVVALVGPNGAGKSTLLTILAGLAPSDTGRASVLGVPAGSGAARQRVAFVSQEMPLYRGLRVRDALHLARNLNTQWDQRYAEERLAKLDIPLTAKAGKLSGGQQAQVAITLALARRPELLLLDEPMARLDPLARHDFLASLMATVAEENLSVVFSSHVIAELQRIASYLIVLSHGRVQIAGETDDLLESHQVLTGPADEVSSFPGSFSVISVQQASRQAHVLARYDGPPPPGWQSREPGLEELVLSYLREPGASMLPGPVRDTTAAEVAQ